LFITPRGPWVTGRARGPAILDSRGELVWIENEKFTQAMNLNVQQYKGQDYLTFWTKTKKAKKSKKGKKDKESKKSSHAKHSKYSYVLVGYSPFHSPCFLCTILISLA
jgi:hypothetical protein